MTETFATGEQAALVLIAALIFSILAGVAIGSALANLSLPPYRKENDHPMKTIWTKLKNAFRSLLAGTRQLFYVVWTASKKELADILNDKQLQELALQAVRMAAQSGLTAEERWNIAWQHFKGIAEAKGWQLGTAILETILQTAYTVYKYTEGNGKDSTIPTGPEV